MQKAGFASFMISPYTKAKLLSTISDGVHFLSQSARCSQLIKGSSVQCILQFIRFQGLPPSESCLSEKLHRKLIFLAVTEIVQNGGLFIQANHRERAHVRRKQFHGGRLLFNARLANVSGGRALKLVWWKCKGEKNLFNIRSSFLKHNKLCCILVIHSLMTLLVTQSEH